MGVICALSTGKWHSDKRGDLLTPCTLSLECRKAASMWLSFVCGSKWIRYINVSPERPCEAGRMVMNARGGISIDTAANVWNVGFEKEQPCIQIQNTHLSFCFVCCLSYFFISLVFSISFLTVFNNKSLPMVRISQDVNATFSLKLCIAWLAVFSVVQLSSK